MSQSVLPGHYKLLAAVISIGEGAGPRSRRSLDIAAMVPEFSIEESIENDSLRGIMTVYDNIGLLEDLPLRGEETLTIQIEDSLKQTLTYIMAVYKITDVEIKKTNDGLMYKLHFMSKSSFDAGFRKILEPHEDTISNIVSYVFDKYYPSREGKGLITEETTGIFRCIIPDYTPQQTMNFLARRSFSTTSPSCSFRFFETSDSFYFVSDEFLIKRFIEDKNSIKEFYFSDAIEKTEKEFILQIQNINEIINSDRINTIVDLVSGAYRSNVVEIDIIKRQCTLPGKSVKYEYNYQNEKQKYMSTSGRSVYEDIHTPAFVDQYFTSENERKHIIVRDYEDSGTLQLRGDQFLPQIITNRIAYRHHLKNTILYAKLAGRLDLNAGDLINLKIPEFNSSSSKSLNRQLSGYYMISDLIHSFQTDIHETSLKLIKFDWSTEE